MTRARRAALTLAFAALFALSFPFRAGDLRFDVGPVAAWLALAPLWLLIRGESPLVAFRRTFLAAWLGYTGVFWWLFIVITVYGRAPALGGIAGTVGVAAYCALCVAAGAALTAALAPYAGRVSLLLLPAAWIVADRVRALESVAAFPWAFLGYAAHADAPLRGLASLTGVYGLSFAYLYGGVLLAERRIAGALALIAALHAVGWLALPGSLTPAESPARVAMIQGNIPQNEKWDPVFEKQNFSAQLEVSRKALESRVDLLIWPEASFPAPLLTRDQERWFPGLADSQVEFRDPVLALARDTQTPMLVGALGLTVVPGERFPRLHNTAFSIDPGTGIADRHDKTVLVPFGEYVPLRSLVFGSMKAVASGLADVPDLTPGGEVRALSGLGKVGAEHAPAVLICYEVVYPGVVRRAVREGARLLINTTNDAWYGRSSAPHQFLAIAQLRSAEHGLPMLRDANTGVTALIDASGAVLEQTEIFERTSLVVTVPPARASATTYTRAGDWPLWAGALLLAVTGGRAVVGRRRR